MFYSFWRKFRAAAAQTEEKKKTIAHKSTTALKYTNTVDQMEHKAEKREQKAEDKCIN